MRIPGRVGGHKRALWPVLALSILSCGRPVEGPNVVLIVIDTLRADHVGVLGAGEGRTPVLDSLAAGGALFEQCFSQYPLTLPSISTLLASEWPNVHRVRENYDERLADRAITIAEVFRERGYRTGAFVSALPVRAETGCAQGFDRYDDDFSEPFEFYREQFVPLASRWTGSERRGDRTIERAIAWIEKTHGPYFLFVHLFDPHSPYDPPEPYASAQPTAYAGEVAFADELVGRLVTAIRDRSDASPVVAVVSDHGEGLGEHEEWAHGLFVYDTTVHVPWIMWWPGHIPQTRIARQVRLLDVAPTILDAVGWTPPGEWAGRSALALIRGENEPDRVIYTENHFPRVEYGWSEQRALITPDWKWIRVTRPELFDRAADPSELGNLVDVLPDTAAALDARLSAFEASSVARAGSPGIDGLVEEIQPEPRVRQWLENLGYIGGGVTPRSGPLPDPKDMVPDWNRTNESDTHSARGNQFLAAGELPLALQAFETAVDRKATAGALKGLGITLARLGRMETADERLRASLDLAPNDVETLSARAVALDALGRLGAADSLLMRATFIDSTLSDAWCHRGDLNRRLGRERDAISFYERCVSLSPGAGDATETLAGLHLRAGDAGRAVALYRLLRDARPWDPVVQWRLGQAEIASGDESAGRRTLEAARAKAGPGATRDSIDAALRRLGGG